jgi:hypothetical protein
MRFAATWLRVPKATLPIFADQTSNLTILNNSLLNNDLLFFVENSPCVGSLDDCGEALHLQTVTGSTIFSFTGPLRGNPQFKQPGC